MCHVTVMQISLRAACNESLYVQPQDVSTTEANKRNDFVVDNRLAINDKCFGIFWSDLHDFLACGFP